MNPFADFSDLYLAEDGDGGGDQTECEGCGAGNEYECVCPTVDDLSGDGPERDWHQEWKDDQMQRPQEEPDDDYWGVAEQAEPPS